jgi:L-ascorbate metabolism protein UlaG (beta-lactamase superfamily)
MARVTARSRRANPSTGRAAMIATIDTRARMVLLALALALPACSARMPEFDALPRQTTSPHVELRYLGSGGWLFRRGPDVIATAPFVSNPTWFALLRSAKPDKPLIERVVPRMDDVEIVLVGHAHYDHAMDLPYIAKAKAPNAVFYGGRTMANILPTRIPAERLRALTDGELAVGGRPGRWFYNRTRTIRFMPLTSTHAPHFARRKLVATGTVDQPQARLPGAPLSWKEGETIAFLIDFLGEGGRVDFRIYYQDAASQPGTGVVPALASSDAAPVDVAILCTAAFDQVDDNPEHILRNVQPRRVLAGHWEDFFFRGYEDPLRPAFGTSLDEFQRRARNVSATPIHLPKPGDTLYAPIVRP